MPLNATAAAAAYIDGGDGHVDGPGARAAGKGVRRLVHPVQGGVLDDHDVQVAPVRVAAPEAQLRAREAHTVRACETISEKRIPKEKANAIPGVTVVMASTLASILRAGWLGYARSHPAAKRAQTPAHHWFVGVLDET